MKLTDAVMSVGFDYRLGDFQELAEPDSLLRTMDRFRIDRALIRAGDSLASGFAESNRRLFSIAARHDRFIPAPIVVPDTAAETGESEAFIAGLVEQGAMAAWLMPKSYEIPLLPATIGPLCVALQAHALPLFLDRQEIGPAELAQLCSAWPELKVVLCGGSHRMERWIYTFLEIYPNLYLGTVPPSYTNEGIEHMVRRCGPARLLFATSYPLGDPAGTIACLSYAAIPDAARESIGHGNLEGLLKCVH